MSQDLCNNNDNNFALAGESVKFLLPNYRMGFSPVSVEDSFLIDIKLIFKYDIMTLTIICMELLIGIIGNCTNFVRRNL
jgi:hypothetical protein